MLRNVERVSLLIVDRSLEKSASENIKSDRRFGDEDQPTIALKCPHNKFLRKCTPTIATGRDLSRPVDPKQLILIRAPILQRHVHLRGLPKRFNTSFDLMAYLQLLGVSQSLD